MYLCFIINVELYGNLAPLERAGQRTFREDARIYYGKLLLSLKALSARFHFTSAFRFNSGKTILLPKSVVSILPVILSNILSLSLHFVKI